MLSISASGGEDTMIRPGRSIRKDTIIEEPVAKPALNLGRFLF
jgi:hypothetical protein